MITPEKVIKDLQEKKRAKMVHSFAMSNLLLEVVKIALIDGIKGTNFRNPKMFNKLDKVTNLLEDIQKSEVGKICKLKDDYADVMENEHALELYELIGTMAFYPTEHLQEFREGIISMQKESK